MQAKGFWSWVKAFRMESGYSDRAPPPTHICTYHSCQMAVALLDITAFIDTEKHMHMQLLVSLPDGYVLG